MTAQGVDNVGISAVKSYARDFRDLLEKSGYTEEIITDTQSLFLGNKA